MKKLYIKTYGCQMNVYDSDRMADVLANIGYVVVDGPESANLILLNTCHIREKAAEKLYSELGRLAPVKKAQTAKGEMCLILVAGCTAQAEGAEIRRRAPYVDLVVGPQAYHKLPELMAEAEREYDKETGKVQGAGIFNVDFPAQSKFDFLPETAKAQKASAFLTIQEGCDKFCHFCVVPYTRGAEYSRSVSELMIEAKRLLSLGAKEIVLLGQNVNAYHGLDESGKERGLGYLLQRLAELDGLARLRYTTSHPRDVDNELVQAHGSVPQLMPFLHLPVQSGSDHVLKVMNRKHTADHYRRVVDDLRAAQPGLVFSSDFIVGYPGEGEKEFQDTLKLVEEVNFAQAYSFKYSVRPGTPGSMIQDQIPDDIKSERLTALQGLLQEQQLAFNKGLQNTSLSVLFERTGKFDNQIVGRAPYYQHVHVESMDKSLIGQERMVDITEYGLNSLMGTLVSDSRR